MYTYVFEETYSGGNVVMCRRQGRINLRHSHVIESSYTVNTMTMVSIEQLEICTQHDHLSKKERRNKGGVLVMRRIITEER